VQKTGVVGFVDKRRKSDRSFGRAPIGNKGEVSVSYSQSEDSGNYEIQGSLCIKLKNEDLLSNKILTHMLLDCGAIEQQKAAEILACHRNAVYENRKKWKTCGSQGLMDGRRGQQNDYKFDSNVKKEMVSTFVCNVIDGQVPTKSTITGHINKKFAAIHSESAVAAHLNKIGLLGDKEKAIRKIWLQFLCYGSATKI